MTRPVERSAEHPFAHYSLVCSYGAFVGVKAAITDLLMQTTSDDAEAKSERYRITDFPDSTTRPLYVCGFTMDENGEVAAFREAVEDLRHMPRETRYVIMAKHGTTWRLLGIFTGPSSDTKEWAVRAMQYLMKEHAK